MDAYIKWLEDQSKLIRIIFCISILDISWAVYRIGRAVLAKNWLHLILGIIWIFVGGSIGWILDLIWMICFNHIFWFKED